VKRSFQALLELVLVILLVAFLAALVTRADAQVAASGIKTLVLSTNVAAASAQTTITSDRFVPSGLAGFGVMPTFAGSGAGAAAVTLLFQASHDGTNWTTTFPFSAAFTANGTNTVRGYFNVDATGTNGPANARYIRLGAVSNTNTNAITISDLKILRTIK
jgi:hypothetical protein